MPVIHTPRNNIHFRLSNAGKTPRYFIISIAYFPSLALSGFVVAVAPPRERAISSFANSILIRALAMKPLTVAAPIYHNFEMSEYTT